MKLTPSVTLYEGDCLDVLATMADLGQQVEAVVTDPPYHLTSVTKRFGKPDSAPAQHGTDGAFARQSAGFMGKQWDGGDIAFRPETWAAVMECMRPGAYLLAFSSTRTFGRMQVAIEDAGFITHPFIAWVFGQGFPKAHKVDDPAWEGWRYGGQALKPAIEPIYMGQKPFEAKNGTENVLLHGCGALNIEGCRVGTDGGCAGAGKGPSNGIFGDGLNGAFAPRVDGLGRWPANLIHDGSDEVLAAFPDAPGQQAAASSDPGSPHTRKIYGKLDRADEPMEPRNDSSSAARFFYCAKASKKDRAGSRHPTVKPLSLMRYLVRLVTPPDGTVLDPFAGTGTTLQAAEEEGFRAIGIEREAEYADDIRHRFGVQPEWLS